MNVVFCIVLSNSFCLIGADGHVYVGDWVEDKMHGKGRFTWSNGDM